MVKGKKGGPAVAVVGAGGMGHYVVGWLIRHGCQVEAIVGRNNNARNLYNISRDYGLKPLAYNSLESMLRELPGLDGAVVRSPDRLHSDHVKKLTSAGIPVLCEKPLHWEDDINKNIKAADELGALGSGMLGLNTQLAHIALPAVMYAGLKQGDVTGFFYRNTTAGKKQGMDIVADLLPHAISVLQRIRPNSSISDARYQMFSRQKQVFSLSYSGIECWCVLEEDPARPEKRMLELGFNGRHVRVTGEKRGAEYSCRLDSAESDPAYVEDALSASVRHFSERLTGRGDFLVGLEEAVENQRLLARAYALLRHDARKEGFF